MEARMEEAIDVLKTNDTSAAAEPESLPQSSSSAASSKTRTVSAEEYTDPKIAEDSDRSKLASGSDPIDTSGSEISRATEEKQSTDRSGTTASIVSYSGDTGHSFTVFEGQEFDLCGYRDFTASIAGTRSEHTGIYLKSEDRDIPDIPFRGFETKLPFKTATELWPGCVVMAAYVDVGGTVRYIFTVE